MMREMNDNYEKFVLLQLQMLMHNNVHTLHMVHQANNESLNQQAHTPKIKSTLYFKVVYYNMT
jgi:hypothetical protein